jgi:hypothetical protein
LNVASSGGTLDNVQSSPWTLLDPQDWNPLGMEQLLLQAQERPSRQVTPQITPEQSQRSHPHIEADEYQFEEQRLDLTLQPHQQLQEGRVHVLPAQHVLDDHCDHTQDIYLTYWQHIQNHQYALQNDEKYAKDNQRVVDDPKYARRLQQAATELGAFPPHFEHIRKAFAHLMVKGESQFKERAQEKAPLAKLKRLIHK